MTFLGCENLNGQFLAECIPEVDCVCDDAKNNTFSCVRRIKLDETGTNVTDNLVYCEFVDSENFIEGILFHCFSISSNNFGFTERSSKTLSLRFDVRVKKCHQGYPDSGHFKDSFVIKIKVYDMTKDPFQTTNARNTMDPQLLQNLNDLLITLSTCAGGVFD